MVNINEVFNVAKKGMGKVFGSGDVETKKYGRYKDEEKKGLYQTDSLRQDVAEKKYQAEVRKRSTPRYRNMQEIKKLESQGYKLVKDAQGNVTQAYLEAQYTTYRTSGRNIDGVCRYGTYVTKRVYFNADLYKTNVSNFAPALTYKHRRNITGKGDVTTKKWGIYKNSVHNYDSFGRETRFRKYSKPQWNKTYGNSEVVSDYKYKVQPIPESEGGGYYHIPVSSYIEKQNESGGLKYKQSVNYQTGQSYMTGYQNYQGYPTEEKQYSDEQQIMSNSLGNRTPNQDWWRQPSKMGPSETTLRKAGLRPLSSSGNWYPTGKIIRNITGEVIGGSLQFGEYKGKTLTSYEAEVLTGGNVAPNRFVNIANLQSAAMGGGSGMPMGMSAMKNTKTIDVVNKIYGNSNVKNKINKMI